MPFRNPISNSSARAIRAERGSAVIGSNSLRAGRDASGSGSPGESFKFKFLSREGVRQPVSSFAYRGLERRILRHSLKDQTALRFPAHHQEISMRRLRRFRVRVRARDGADVDQLIAQHKAAILKRSRNQIVVSN